MPNTQDENTFLASMNPSAVWHTWIGFDFTNNEKWEDGTASSQSDSWRVLYNVDDAADRDNGEPATFIRPSGDWSFDAKGSSFSYICEKPMSAYGKTFFFIQLGPMAGTCQWLRIIQMRSTITKSDSI